MISRRFAHGTEIRVHRFANSGPRGARVKVHAGVISGVGVARPTSASGTFPVDVPETSRQIQVRDLDADVRSGDWVTFPEGHRLSGSWWRVHGEVLDFESPFTGWRAGLTFRIERDHDPGVT